MAAGFAPNSSPKTAARDARRLAQKGEIREAIEKMQLELLPQPKDLRAINEHAMAVIVRLSLEAEEEKVKLAAAQWLHEETAKQLVERERLEKIQQQRPPRRESQEKIVAELRMLYERALPGREPPWLEAVSDGTADGQEGEAPAENLSQAAAAPEDAAEMPEKVEERPEYRMLPGRFPPRRVRVR
jgi:hypothetical protein